MKHGYVSFIQDLREFSQHYSILPIAAQVIVVDQNIEIKQLTLSKQELLEFDSWDRHSKNFIKNIKDVVNVESTTSDYQKTISGFYTWLHRTLSQLYSVELSEFESKYAEYERIQKKFLEQILQGKTSGTLK